VVVHIEHLKGKQKAELSLEKKREKKLTGFFVGEPYLTCLDQSTPS